MYWIYSSVRKKINTYPIFAVLGCKNDLTQKDEGLWLKKDGSPKLAHSSKIKELDKILLGCAY